MTLSSDYIKLVLLYLNIHYLLKSFEPPQLTRLFEKKCSNFFLVILMILMLFVRSLDRIVKNVSS